MPWWGRVSRAISVTIMLALAWLVAASFLYCQLATVTDAGHRAFPFEYPFTQWLVAVPHWLANWRITVSIVASAALPTILLVLAGVVEWRRRTRANERKLFGAVEWAGPAAMRKAGITTSRRQ